MVPVIFANVFAKFGPFFAFVCSFIVKAFDLCWCQRACALQLQDDERKTFLSNASCTLTSCKSCMYTYVYRNDSTY